jgi:transcriptional regulator with XRE-family HTH domain
VDPKDVTVRILERLRIRILRSDLTQRAVESRVGFSRGYLSLLLNGTVELKYWHLLAILHAMELEPSEFFGELFPRRHHPALESLDDVASRSEEGSLTFELAGLFGMGLETVVTLRERLALCEEAIDELTDLGVLPKDDEGET